MQCPLEPFPELVMEPNRTCLLLTPLLLPIIIWLAEMLTLLRKNPLLIFSCFSGFRATGTYYKGYFGTLTKCLDNVGVLG